MDLVRRRLAGGFASADRPCCKWHRQSPESLPPAQSTRAARGCLPALRLRYPHGWSVFEPEIRSLPDLFQPPARRTEFGKAVRPEPESNPVCSETQRRDCRTASHRADARAATQPRFLYEAHRKSDRYRRQAPPFPAGAADETGWL